MNMALAVNPTMEYSVVRSLVDMDYYLLASSRRADHFKELGYESAEAVESAAVLSMPGSHLEGLEYEPLFDYYTDTEKWGTQKAWRVLLADFVTDSGGTGVVHLAPAHGEDDQKTCEANGVPAFLSVDEGANYLPEVTDFAGVNVFDAVKPVMRHLRANGVVFSERDYHHEYPHCWRCGTPLVYKAVSSWFVRVTAFRDRMVELNQEVNWTPANVKDGVFGNWVANARDWSVSRNRYWGSPVPVWKSDDPAYPRVDVYGSLAEMEADFGVPVTDLHRPFVDSLVRPNPDDPTGKSMMRRVEDVLDVWFDSGAMPFAQMHYPFENVEKFEANHPSDFVVEYVGQTRGWFYVMHALSTALFDRPAFKNAVSHGVVLGNDGLKMSKKTKNYPDVNDVFNRDGSDAMRWFLMSSPVLRGGTLSVTDKAVTDGMRSAMLPLWNAYCFYRLYSVKHTPTWRTDSTNVLDRYLMAKLHDVVGNVTTALEGFDSVAASDHLTEFLDMLNNWYVRRSRARLWDEDVDAFDTLYTALEVLSRLAAPLLPMLTEVVWKGLTGARSVHLTDYPLASEFPADPAAVAAMDEVREVSSAALSLRKKHNLRVRQPLSSMTVVTEDAAKLNTFVSLLCEELNVKDVVLVEKTGDSAAEFGVDRKLKLNAPVVGKRLGKNAQTVFGAARSGDWQETADGVVVGRVALVEGEFEFVLEGNDDDALSFLKSDGFVMLDVALTPELESEGFMRDVVRAVQDARKNAELNVSDRVHLGLAFESFDDAALFGLDYSYLADETLALKVEFGSVSGFDYSETVAAGRYVNRGDFSVGLTVVDRA